MIGLSFAKDKASPIYAGGEDAVELSFLFCFMLKKGRSPSPLGMTATATISLYGTSAAPPDPARPYLSWLDLKGPLQTGNCYHLDVVDVTTASPSIFESLEEMGRQETIADGALTKLPPSLSYGAEIRVNNEVIAQLSCRGRNGIIIDIDDYNTDDGKPSFNLRACEDTEYPMMFGGPIFKGDRIEIRIITFPVDP